VKQLEFILAEEDEEERGYITAKDFMNDFATEDFLKLNIRVRPVSGVARQEEEGRLFPEFPVAVQGREDEEEKFNKMANIEMEEKRREVKSRVS